MGATPQEDLIQLPKRDRICVRSSCPGANPCCQYSAGVAQSDRWKGGEWWRVGAGRPPPLAGTMLTWARLSLCGQVTGSLSHSHHFTPKYPLSANPGQSKVMTLKRGTFADGAPPREKPRSS